MATIDPVLDPIRDPPESPPASNAHDFLTQSRPGSQVVRPPGGINPSIKPKVEPKPVVRPPGYITKPKAEPQPVVRPPSAYGARPVQFANPKPDPGYLPVEPRDGAPNGVSGSGGMYSSGMSPKSVGQRRGLTRYSNPVHPSSSRRRLG